MADSRAASGIPPTPALPHKGGGGHRAAASRVCLRAVAWIVSLWLCVGAAFADSTGRYTTRTPYEDVVFELDNAIVARGLSIHSTGNNFAGMLTRTGPAVGSTREVYKQATFVEVCSGKHARAMVEADPGLIGNCPFALYVYERADTPGEVTVGFRRLAPGANAASRNAVAETEALLDGIARDAAK